MPIDAIQEPPAEVVVVEETALQSIATELKALRSGMAHQFDMLNARIARLETAHNDSGFAYRVLRDAVDHARLVALRVETRLDNMDLMDEQRKVRARMDTLPGPGDTDRPPANGVPESANGISEPIDGEAS
jgi:hypothetical protein